MNEDLTSEIRTGLSMEENERKTILIVDDDLFIRTGLSDVLTKHGYAVITAKDGIEAFKELTQGNPDVIIIDKVMPNFDGFEFCKLLRGIRKFHPIPIILISGQMTPEDEEEAMHMGFFDYLQKPINEMTLVRRVRWALGFYDRLRSIL
jgi:chemosensory pili system protein ChpA (sensor histidine kinase/response regulator)